MSIQLKICGITSLADARFCAGAGADYLGFIFHSESPRFVDPARVREITEWIHGPEIVGVFVDEDPDTVNRIADEANLTVVQLHGSESLETCRTIDRPIIKALRIKRDERTTDIAHRIHAFGDNVELFLLDTYREDKKGGTGETFDWSVAASLATEFPILLSGGIRVDNVRRAVETVRAVGIDLSSGVEREPGNKDFDLLGDFFDVFDSLRDAQPSFAI